VKNIKPIPTPLLLPYLFIYFFTNKRQFKKGTLLNDLVVPATISSPSPRKTAKCGPLKRQNFKRLSKAPSPCPPFGIAKKQKPLKQFNRTRGNLREPESRAWNAKVFILTPGAFAPWLLLIVNRYPPRGTRVRRCFCFPATLTS